MEDNKNSQAKGHPWTANEERLMLAAVQSLRPFVVISKDAIRGSRFNSDDWVTRLARLRYSMAEVNEAPLGCATECLRQAAETDLWYQNEKDYGRDEAADQDDAEATNEAAREAQG